MYPLSSQLNLNDFYSFSVEIAQNSGYIRLKIHKYLKDVLPIILADRSPSIGGEMTLSKSQDDL